MSDGEYNARSIDAVIAEMHANQRTILEKLSELHDKHDAAIERHVNVEKRLELLERWRWILVGVFAVGGIGGGVTADTLGKLLKSLSAVLLVVLLFTGCASVPETVIRYDKNKNGVVISSPKDVEIQQASIIVQSNSVVRVEFIGYKARNNVEVIRAIAERNQSVLENAAKTGGALMGEVLSHMK